MAHKIIWSPEAVADLTEIRDYIARDSEAYAAAMIERVLTAVDPLAEFPKLGQSVPEMDDKSLRQIVVYPYRLIYRVSRYSVDIAAVVHGARDLPEVMTKRRI
jgi:toxin ParE1/3/4